MGVSHILVIFSIWFLGRCSGLAPGSVNSCYYCNHLEKDIHPQHCHDPADVKHLLVQNCTTVFSEVKDVPRSNHTKFVCMKMALKLNGTFMIARECSIVRHGNESSCEFYERYLQKLGRGPVTDVKCSVCHKDLCNVAPVIHLSLFAVAAAAAFKLLSF